MQLTFPKGQHQHIYTFISLDACSESNLLLDKGILMSTWSVYLDGRAWSKSQLHSSSPFPFSIALYQQSAFFPLRKAQCLPQPTPFRWQEDSAPGWIRCLSKSLSCVCQWMPRAGCKSKRSLPKYFPIFPAFLVQGCSVDISTHWLFITAQVRICFCTWKHPS